MYLRAVHAEPDTAVLQQFIHEHPFALLITSLPSTKYPTIQCTHIPWVLEEYSTDSLGVLRGHLARANPHAQAIMEAATQDGSLTDEVSVIFSGPVNSYVTPQFYTDTKPTSGKVVPTWNYAAAQVYGKARVFADKSGAETQDWLQQQVESLTGHAEEHVLKDMGADTDKSWAVSDAPERYIEIMKKSIIGVEIRIERLEGKFKMSQEMNESDRAGVCKGFEDLGTDHGVAMAEMVAERGRLKQLKAASA